MRKRRAILLFGALTLLIVGYVAWCWHPMYVDPPVRYHGEVRAQHRETIKEWIAENAGIYGWRPERSWRTRVSSLLHPYEVGVTRLTVMAGGWPYFLRCENQGAVWYEELRMQPNSVIVQGADPDDVARLEKVYLGK